MIKKIWSDTRQGYSDTRLPVRILRFCRVLTTRYGWWERSWRRLGVGFADDRLELDGSGLNLKWADGHEGRRFEAWWTSPVSAAAWKRAESTRQGYHDALALGLRGDLSRMVDLGQIGRPSWM